jgi:hypothetical protein
LSRGERALKLNPLELEFYIIYRECHASLLTYWHTVVLFCWLTGVESSEALPWKIVPFKPVALLLGLLTPRLQEFEHVCLAVVDMRAYRDWMRTIG